MCFSAPIRNDPEKKHINKMLAPTSPKTILQIGLCLCVFSLPDKIVGIRAENFAFVGARWWGETFWTPKHPGVRIWTSAGSPAQRFKLILFCSSMPSDGPKIEHKLFFSNFSGTAGISQQNPGTCLISWFRGTYRTFLAPTPSRERPLPHRKRSGSKV